MLMRGYLRWVEELLPRFAEADFDAALSLARLPEQIRGFGHVKQASVEVAHIRRGVLMKRLFAKAPQVESIADPAQFFIS